MIFRIFSVKAILYREEFLFFFRFYFFISFLCYPFDTTFRTNFGENDLYGKFISLVFSTFVSVLCYPIDSVFRVVLYENKSLWNKSPFVLNFVLFLYLSCVTPMIRSFGYCFVKTFFHRKNFF